MKWLVSVATCIPACASIRGKIAPPNRKSVIVYSLAVPLVRRSRKNLAVVG